MENNVIFIAMIIVAALYVTIMLFVWQFHHLSDAMDEIMDLPEPDEDDKHSSGKMYMAVTGVFAATFFFLLGLALYG